MTTVPTASRAAPRVSVLVALGVFFWFVAAMAFRLLGERVFSLDSPWVPLLFASAVPVAWAFVEAGKRLSGARGGALMPAVSVMSATAMLLDALALVFVPALYGMPVASLLLVAAYLLWGVGLILFIAYLQAR